jgi:hypothetical protein
MIRAVAACSWTAVVIVHEMPRTMAPINANKAVHSERAVTRMIKTSPSNSPTDKGAGRT